MIKCIENFLLFFIVVFWKLIIGRDLKKKNVNYHLIFISISQDVPFLLLTNSYTLTTVMLKKNKTNIRSHYLIISPVNEVQGRVYRNHSVCKSVCPSVCAGSCPALLCFDIGLSYLTHVCIIMNRKVKYIGILTWLCVRATAFLCYDIVILYLAQKCITMGQCVTYIQDLSMTWSVASSSNSLFHDEFVSWQDRLCSLTQEYHIRQMDVSPSSCLI